MQDTEIVELVVTAKKLIRFDEKMTKSKAFLKFIISVYWEQGHFKHLKDMGDVDSPLYILNTQTHEFD